MRKSYVIQWKSKVNGRAGRGNKLFNQEEAERLAAELNREYPEIQHEPLPLDSPVASPEGAEARDSQQHSPGEPEEAAPSLFSH